MGNTSSHTHEPLERGFTRDRFGDIKNTVGLFMISFCLGFVFLLIFFLLFTVMLNQLTFTL